MRVAVLAHSLRVTGGLTVGMSIIEALPRVAPQHTYFFVVPAELGYEPLCQQLADAKVLAYRASGRLGRWRFDRGPLLQALRSFAPDVILSLNGQGLIDPPAPQALFPQDPHLFYPSRHFAREQLLNKLKKAILKRRLGKQLRHTALIFCQTSVVESRIRQTFGYTGAARIIYSAPSRAITQGGESRMPPAYLPYQDRLRLLYVSGFYAHKNVELLADVIEQHAADLGGITFFVTVSAAHHPRARAFLKRLEHPRYRGRLINLGHVPHETIRAAYQHAHALIMPTFLETFGLPYVEAMSVGLPILTSDLDFAHAVCSDAALYFNPWSTESLRDCLVRFRDSASLRTDLAVRSRARLPQLATDWDGITSLIMSGVRSLVEPAAPRRSNDHAHNIERGR